MTLEENRADLERHARDFAARSGFTYTVLDPSDPSVIGCVYIYPDQCHDRHEGRMTASDGYRSSRKAALGRWRLASGTTGQRAMRDLNACP